MCGRINVTDDPLCQWIGEQLGLDFHTPTNADLRPSERLSGIIKTGEHLQQQHGRWGIQPSWAKRLLINAQAETVAEKRTFAHGIANHRGVIPCSGWYEWRLESGIKHKYLFQSANHHPLLMAAIYYPQDVRDCQWVTLTTRATPQCAAYHGRMPLLIEPHELEFWFNADLAELIPLLHPPSRQFSIVPA